MSDVLGATSQPFTLPLIMCADLRIVRSLVSRLLAAALCAASDALPIKLAVLKLDSRLIVAFRARPAPVRPRPDRTANGPRTKCQKCKQANKITYQIMSLNRNEEIIRECDISLINRFFFIIRRDNARA